MLEPICLFDRTVTDLFARLEVSTKHLETLSKYGGDPAGAIRLAINANNAALDQWRRRASGKGKAQC
jgi:hypothetical protein